MKMNEQVAQEYLGGIETERLILQPMVDGEQESWLPFISSPECAQFLAFDQSRGADVLCEEWYARQLQRYGKREGGLLNVIHKEEGVLVGQVGLLAQVVEAEEEWEIGYHLLREYWGEGYATEAAIALREFAREHRLAKHIISIIHVDNHKSKAVALRNGMQRWKRTRFKGLEVDVFRLVLFN